MWVGPAIIIHAAGVRPLRRRVLSDIIRAEGAFCGVRNFVREMGSGLSRRGGTLEFVAEVLKVFLADLQLPYFFDHRREVRQRADRSQGRSAGGAYEPPYRTQTARSIN